MLISLPFQKKLKETTLQEFLAFLKACSCRKKRSKTSIFYRFGKTRFTKRLKHSNAYGGRKVAEYITEDTWRLMAAADITIVMEERPH